MLERLAIMTFTVEGQADADSVHGFKALNQLTIVGVSLCAEAFTGTPTGFNVDIQAATADVITAVAANSAKTPGVWKSKALGGTEDPVHIAAGSTVEIDVNLTGGSSPTADYTLQLWVLVGE